MEKYLYGSVVNKIQKFIFETGKLKEIIGASEWIERICQGEFIDAVGASYKEENLIVGAAGKVTYLFEDADHFQDFLLKFHKSILAKTPNLNITQAAVKVEDFPKKEDFKTLEERLTIQKNKLDRRHGIGWMAMERSRRTGGPAISFEKVDQVETYLDRQQKTKLELSYDALTLFGKLVLDVETYAKRLPTFIEDIVSGKEGEWIAVVHADGNNLGKLIQTLAAHVGADKPGLINQVLKEFSKKLDEATRFAAKEAFETIILPVIKKEGEKSFLPLRPVLLGGDDLTLIIRGDLAIPFTEKFLSAFEYHTQNNFTALVSAFKLPQLNKGLTACAGIAYIKPKFPFHYGVDLAESLCSYAKKKSKDYDKDKAPSCLAFHRVQSAFVEEYSSIIEKELTTNTGVSFCNGPYFLQPIPDYSTISELRKWVDHMLHPYAPKAPIREWLTELEINKASAQQLMERIKNLNPSFISKLKLEAAITDKASTHLFDVMTIANIEKT